MLAVSGPLRGPFFYVLVPQATQADGLCALGLCQVKAVGLVQVDDLLVRYSKPLKLKNSSIYIYSRGHNIYRILYPDSNNLEFSKGVYAR